MRRQLTRRGFCRLLAASSLALLPRCASQDRTDFDVIIIGAGMAGLSAASALRARGLAVVVLEARDRIGGRIHTDRSLGLAIDLGASWIHGVTANPLTDLARQFGAATVATSLDSDTLYGIDGKPRADQDALFASYASVMTALDDQRQAAQQAGMPDVPLSQPLWAAIDRTNPSASQRQDWTFEVDDNIDAEYATDVADLSFYNWDEGADELGGDVLFPGGYDTLIDGLAVGLDIRTGHVVSRIEHSPGQVTVTTSAETFVAPKLLCTLPLAVLQQGSVEFVPALPAAKLVALGHLGMGLMNKVALRFPAAFWAADDTDWITRITATEGEGSEFLNYQRIANQPVIVCFLTADLARAMEPRADDEIVAAIMQSLRTIYGDAVLDPTATVITRWASEPYSLGSYSHIRPGGASSDRVALAAPIDDTVYFAGEATVTDHPATVRGAYQSGQRAATLILG